MRIQPALHAAHLARPVPVRTEIRSGKGPERRGGAPSQANMLDMADDASGLAAALRSRRSGATDAETAGSGLPWLDCILADDGAARVAELRDACHGTDDIGTLARLAQDILADPSDLVAAIRVLIAEASAEPLRLARLKALLAELETRFTDEAPDAMKHVRAGLNVATQARSHARKLKLGSRTLRASYRQFLGADLEPTLLYELWVDQYGFDRRLGVLTFVEQALAADMYSLDPSCARREFGNLLSYARQLTVLRSVDSHLMACPWQDTLCKRTGLAPEQWLKAVFATLRDGPAEARELREALEQARTTLAAGEKASLLVSLRRILTGVPHVLWEGATPQLETLAVLDDWIGAATRVDLAGAPRLIPEFA